MTARFQPPPSPSNLFSNFPATQSILHIAARGILWKWKLDHVLPLLKSLQMPSVAGVCRCDLHTCWLLHTHVLLAGLCLPRWSHGVPWCFSTYWSASCFWAFAPAVPSAWSAFWSHNQVADSRAFAQTSLTKTKSQPMEWLSNINKLQIYMIFENHVHDKRLIPRINKEFLKLKN